MKQFLRFRGRYCPKRTQPTYLIIIYITALLMGVGGKEINAQQRITGRVTDTLDNAIERATVHVKSTNTKTATDSRGLFEITAKSEDMLIITAVGYEHKEIPVAGQGSIDVILTVAANELEEVEINAGYYTTTDKYRTGNIGRVTAAEIDKQPVSNPLLALHGRIPGVVITQQSGVPGNAVKIQIRGQNSLRADGNDPLYIIDGVPVGADPVFRASAGALLPFGLDVLNTINPQNIASIEVLKDADATAIYGSRGANGVVLITTKQGVAERTNVDISIASGVGRVPKKLDLLSTQQYLEMRNEAFANDGTTPNATSAPDLVLWDTGRQTDWQETLLGRHAHYNDAQLSIAGGMAATAFRINAGWKKESMVFPGDMGQQLSSVGFNANHQAFSNKLSLNLAVNYGLAKNNTANHNFVSQALSLPPNAPPLFLEDGSLNWENSTWDNPLSKLNITNSISSENLNANATVGYAVYDGLQVKLNLGYANTHTALERREPISAWDPVWGDALTGSGVWGRDRRDNWIVEPQATYSKVFGYHRLDALVGGTFQSSTSQTFRLNSYGYINDALIGNTGAAANIRVTQDDHIDYRYTAAFARFGYQLMDRYIVNLTGRRDGSTRFGSDKRFAGFGAIGAAWIVSNEPFLKNIKYLNLLKLRGSYGTTGNDRIGDYGYLDVYNVGNYFGITALQPAQLYNPDFSWEVNRKLDMEISAHLFSDRLTVNAGWFRNISSNQLVGYALPATTGFPNVLANLPATVENKGWEFQLSLQGKNASQFSWQTSANISIPKNTLLSYPEIEASSYADTYVVGRSLSVRRLYQFEGVDVETGRYQLRDVNGDGRLDINDRITIVDVGRDFYGGLQQRLGFARFQLSFMLEFVKQNGRGGMLGATGTGAPGRNVNQPVYVMDRWRELGDETHVQRFTASSSLNTLYSNAIASDYNIVDASFLRLRTASLTYLWESTLLTTIGLRQCEFSVTAQNLFTITGYEGWDAERPGSSYLPALEVYTFGVRLRF